MCCRLKGRKKRRTGRNEIKRDLPSVEVQSLYESTMAKLDDRNIERNVDLTNEKLAWKSRRKTLKSADIKHKIERIAEQMRLKNVTNGSKPSDTYSNYKTSSVWMDKSPFSITIGEQPVSSAKSPYSTITSTPYSFEITSKRCPPNGKDAYSTNGQSAQQQQTNQNYSIFNKNNPLLDISQISSTDSNNNNNNNNNNSNHNNIASKVITTQPKNGITKNEVALLRKLSKF